jgi:hypothetical protein
MPELHFRLRFDEEHSMNRVAHWLKSKSLAERRELIITALTAFYFANADQSPETIAYCRGILERRVLDLIHLNELVNGGEKEKLNMSPDSTPFVIRAASAFEDEDNFDEGGF